MRKGEFTTIATHMYPHDAGLAILKARLTDEGIPFFMQDEHYVAIAPFESLAIGGVKLRIRTADEPLVRMLLSEMTPQPPITEEEVDPEDAAWIAERMHIQRQSRARFNKWAPILGVIMLLISLFAYLASELFTPTGPSRPKTYSTNPVP